MRLYVEHLPLMMHVRIVFKLRPCLSFSYAVLIAACEEVLHYDAVEPCLLVFRPHSYKEKIERILLLHQRLQKADPSRRHKVTAAFAHGLSR